MKNNEILNDREKSLKRKNKIMVALCIACAICEVISVFDIIKASQKNHKDINDISDIYAEISKMETVKSAINMVYTLNTALTAEEVLHPEMNREQMILSASSEGLIEPDSFISYHGNIFPISPPYHRIIEVSQTPEENKYSFEVDDSQTCDMINKRGISKAKYGTKLFCQTTNDNKNKPVYKLLMTFKNVVPSVKSSPDSNPDNNKTMEDTEGDPGDPVSGETSGF